LRRYANIYVPKAIGRKSERLEGRLKKGGSNCPKIGKMGTNRELPHGDHAIKSKRIVKIHGEGRERVGWGPDLKRKEPKLELGVGRSGTRGRRQATANLDATAPEKRASKEGQRILI